jgi:hypothetical protein
LIAPLVRGLVAPLAAVLRRLYLARLSQRPERLNLVPPPAAATRAENGQLRAEL